MNFGLRVLSLVLAISSGCVLPSANAQPPGRRVSLARTAGVSLAQDKRATSASVPAPREVLGFDPGDDRKLADWSQIADYFKKLDSASARVQVHQPGLSTE